MATKTWTWGTNWNSFRGNPIAIQAGLIGEKYGERPHKVLGLEQEQTRLEAFWTDAAVRQATVEFQNERKKEAQQGGTKAGTATPQEKNQLHGEQEQRAKLRESMEQAGKQAPSPEGQLDQLQEIREQREQAEPLTEQ